MWPLKYQPVYLGDILHPFSCLTYLETIASKKSIGTALNVLVVK